VLLSDASLKAVQAHRKGATSNDVLSYLSRRFGMTVRPNHLGIALQRHRRAGRLEDREYDEGELAMALAGLPAVPRN